MAVVMKIANQGHINTHAIQLLANVRHLGCCFRRIDSDAHHFRTCIGQFFDLYRRVNGIYRIGLVMFTPASVACALSDLLATLTLMRALQGIGAAGIMTGSEHEKPFTIMEL